MSFKFLYSNHFYIFRVSTQTYAMSFILKLVYVFMVKSVIGSVIGSHLFLLPSSLFAL